MKKPPPVQVAVGDGSMASHVCTLVNGSIISVFNQVRDHVQCKPVPNEQRKHKQLLETGFGKFIQPTSLEKVSVWTP